MRWLFDYDGIVNRIANAVINVVLLGLLWMLFSLPILTIGASTTALYRTADKVLRKEEGYLWSEFWQSFKSNFKQATVAWLLQMVIIWFFALDFYYAYQLFQEQELPQVLMILILLIVVAVFTWLLYWFPYISRFADKTKTMIKNCGFICLGNPHWSALNSVFFAAALILIWYIPVAVIVVPAAYAVISNMIMERVFMKYLTDEDDPQKSAEIAE